MTEEEGGIEMIVEVDERLLDSSSHLNVVVSVVVEVEDPVELRVHRDPQVVRVLDALAERLPRVLLHLDVVELPASRKV